MANPKRETQSVSGSDVGSVDEVMGNPTAPAGVKMPDFSKWTSEQVGFAPYWTPAPGRWFLGILTDVDRRDPDFIRYQFQALLDTPCQRGPGDVDSERHEKVMVASGEHFSTSVYSGLKVLFDEYEGLSFPVPVRVQATVKSKTSKNQDFWNFKVDVHEDTKKLLIVHRQKVKAKELESNNRPELET